LWFFYKPIWCVSATVWEYAVLEGRSEISRDGQGYMKSPYPHLLHELMQIIKKMGNDKDVLVDLFIYLLFFIFPLSHSGTFPGNSYISEEKWYFIIQRHNYWFFFFLKRKNKIRSKFIWGMIEFFLVFFCVYLGWHKCNKRIQKLHPCHLEGYRYNFFFTFLFF
jgi:hypothetical protein